MRRKDGANKPSRKKEESFPAPDRPVTPKEPTKEPKDPKKK